MTHTPPAPSGSRRISSRAAQTPLSLQSFLPYRLNVLAQTVSQGFATAYSATFGMTAPEWRVVSTLGEFERMTAKEISDHSGMHKATISRAVQTLARQKLLVRVPNAADRREEILSLSPRGRQIYETIAPLALRYENGLLEGLSDDDVARLDRVIRHLMARAGLPWFAGHDAAPARSPKGEPAD